MVAGTNKTPQTVAEHDRHVERCLSMILHYEEVQKFAEIIKKIYADRLKLKTD